MATAPTHHTRALACIAAWPDAYDEERCPQIMAFARFVLASDAPEAAIVLAEQACAAERQRAQYAGKQDIDGVRSARRAINQHLWELGQLIGDPDSYSFGVKP